MFHLQLVLNKKDSNENAGKGKHQKARRSDTGCNVQEEEVQARQSQRRGRFLPLKTRKMGVGGWSWHTRSHRRGCKARGEAW